MGCSCGCVPSPAADSLKKGGFLLMMALKKMHRPNDHSRGFVNVQILQNGNVRNPIIRSQHLDVTVNEFCSFGVITIRFRNPFDQPVELLYSFPLIDGGAVVTGMKTEWDGQVIEGIVRDSESGKKEYNDALSKGHTASIVEHAENDLFLWRLGGIPAGADVCVTTRFVGPIYLTKKAGKKAITQFTLTLPTTVPPWYNRACEGDAALAYNVAHVKGVKKLTMDELSALTVDKLRKRLQTMTKAEENKEISQKMRKDALVRRLFQLQQDEVAADCAAAETEAALANDMCLAVPPFAAVVRSNFVTKEFQSVVVTSPTHGSPSTHSSSGPELVVQYDNLFATPQQGEEHGPSNLQLRWSMEGTLPNIACYGSVLAGAGSVATVSEVSGHTLARNQSATRALKEAARVLQGGPLAAEADAFAEKSACSERAVEEVVGLLYSEPSDLPLNEVHVTVLVDFSGSMSGIRIQNAIKSLRAILTSLDHESTFSVFKFGTACVGIAVNNDVVIQASPSNIEKMMSKVLPDADMGGTNLINAVRTVLDVGTQTSRRNNIIMITDGEVGTYEAENVKSLLAAACPCKALAGIIGVGNNVTRATLQAVVDGGFGPQALVFDHDSEETIAENIIGAVGSLLASDFRDIGWPTVPVLCTSNRILINEKTISASWALFSDGRARASEVFVTRVIDETNIPEPRMPKIWTIGELQALNVNKLRKMLRSQLKNDYSSGEFRKKDNMVSRLLERQSELAVSHAAAAQAAADAHARAAADQAERSRPIYVPYFAVTHSETARNMCIVAALTRTRGLSCSSSETKKLALHYGFVGPNSGTVMVAVSCSSSGDLCKSTVAVGLPGSAGHENAEESNLNSAVVWGCGSSGSTPLNVSQRAIYVGTSLNPHHPAKPAAKCFVPLAFSKGVYKAKSASKCVRLQGISVAKSAAKCAPQKCAAKKSASKYPVAYTKTRCTIPASSAISPKGSSNRNASVKRSRDSVSLLDILGALSGGLWRVADLTVDSFIHTFCKSTSSLASDAAATIAVIVILRSKFSAFKKGWHVHVNRSKAFVRKSLGESVYASLKQSFKDSLL